MSWEQAWREGRTRWDAGAAPPILHELVEAGELPEGRAIVPGCGSGYDVFALASERREVVGLDVAPTAAARFEELREEAGVSEDRARIVVTDFFSYRPEAPFDLFWDYTFLCALEPERRPDWERKVHELLAADGELVTLLFPAREEPLNGPGNPPHPLLPEHARELLADRWREVELRPVERSHPGREGLEWIGRWRKR